MAAPVKGRGIMAVASAETWVDQFTSVSNEDAELSAHGGYYSCSFLLDMGEHRYVVRVHRGKVEEIVTDPGPLDERYAFAVAPAQTRGASSPSPPRSRCITGSGPRRSERTCGWRATCCDSCNICAA
jgi:hypothetical protein